MMITRRVMAALWMTAVMAIGQTAMAGSSLGAQVWRGRVEKESTVVIMIEFEAGQPARVFGIGDGDTDVDYIVKDADGTIVASDLEVSDAGYCEFTPERTGVYTIEMKNLGTIWNEVRLATN